MLSIWIGRAGSGKSEKVLRTIAAERTQRAQVLIVPEHTSHRAEVDLCRACGETASRNAEVLSFQNLATRVLSRTGGLADVTLDGGGKLLTMRLALQELSGQLKVFHHPSQRAAFLQQLVELAEEFYAYEICPEELYEKTQEIGGAMGDKLQSVALLFGAYDAKLHAGGRDARSRVEKLRDALGSSQYLAGKDVYVDGYAYFNRLEEDILSIILRQAHQVTVTLLGEKGNQELFQNALRQRERSDTIKAVCMMHPLPEGERWGYPSGEAAYPLAAFHFAGDAAAAGFTLCFEDRDGVRGLHRFYDRQTTREARRERIALSLRLAPDEFAALLAPGTGAPDIRSVFRIDTGTGVVRALLDTVEEYDPEAASVRCTFTRLTEDAL